MKIKPNINILKNTKLDIILATVLGLVLLSIAVFLVIKNFQNKPSSTNDTVSQLTIRDFFEIQDPKSVSINTLKFTAPEGWTFTSNYMNAKDSLFTCAQPSGIAIKSDCLVYEISDGQHTFYITPNFPMLDSSIVGLAESKEPVSILGSERNLVFNKLQVVKRTDESEGAIVEETDIVFVKQAYLCIDVDSCISSGVLSLDIEQNLKDFAKFKSLVSTIKIERK